MYSIFFTIATVALWFVNLFNGTGLGTTYKTMEIASLITLIVAVLCLASQILHDGELLVRPRYFYTIVPLIVIFVGSSLLNGQKLSGLDGAWVYLVVYIMSKTRLDAKTIRMTSICYAVLGLLILLLYNYTELFKGWNVNSIAMIGAFSFLVFTIPFFGMREWRSFVFMPLIGTAYVILLFPTESRSCMIVIILQLLFILRIIPVRKLLETSKGIYLILMVPLFAAIGTVLLATFGNISGLTEWSYETFNKPLFNGREEIWLKGFQYLWEKPLFGNGNINAGYWHNSAMCCLVGFGLFGYFFWNRLFHLILQEGKPYLDDICVIGSIVAFLVLSCQQSVEIGLFAAKPNVIPYVMLGILLGRVRLLREEQQYA